MAEELLYHRLEAPRQTAADAEAMERSGELWGRAPRGSAIPAAQAYRGPLPPGASGVEFTTVVKPRSTVGPANWPAGLEGVEVRIVGGEEFAVIAIRVTRRTQ